MTNEITINADEIRKMPDDSITDGEIIRQIALLKDRSLYSKIKKEFVYAGLYPYVMNSFDILPDKI